MIVLEAGQTIQGVAADASTITYQIWGMQLNAGVETYDLLAQGQLPTTAAALYTVPASTQAFIKQITLINTASSAKSGVILYVGGSAAGNQITGSITMPASGMGVMEEDGWNFYDANGSRLMKVA